MNGLIGAADGTKCEEDKAVRDKIEGAKAGGEITAGSNAGGIKFSIGTQFKSALGDQIFSALQTTVRIPAAW